MVVGVYFSYKCTMQLREMIFAQPSCDNFLSHTHIVFTST